MLARDVLHARYTPIQLGTAGTCRFGGFDHLARIFHRRDAWVGRLGLAEALAGFPVDIESNLKIDAQGNLPGV